MKNKNIKFREEWLAQDDEVRNRIRPVITKNFQALCNIAEVCNTANDGTTIETPQGTFEYRPNPKFSWENK